MFHQRMVSWSRNLSITDYIKAQLFATFSRIFHLWFGESCNWMKVLKSWRLITLEILVLCWVIWSQSIWTDAFKLSSFTYDLLSPVQGGWGGGVCNTSWCLTSPKTSHISCPGPDTSQRLASTRTSALVTLDQVVSRLQLTLPASLMGTYVGRNMM